MTPAVFDKEEVRTAYLGRLEPNQVYPCAIAAGSVFKPEPK
jgi:hypothetical protein